jgi:mannitol-specific phosphotransferase system IIBC component
MNQPKALGVFVAWGVLTVGCVGEGVSPTPSLVVLVFIMLALLVVWRTDPGRSEGRV